MRCVFRRCKVCKAVSAGSCLWGDAGRHCLRPGAGPEGGCGQGRWDAWCRPARQVGVDPTRPGLVGRVGTHRSWACSNGFPLSTSVCRCTSRRICGGRLSRRFSLRSRYSRSVRLMKSWLGMVSMLWAEGQQSGLCSASGVSHLPGPARHAAPVVAEVQHQHVLGVLQLPRALRQLVVAQVLGRG